MRGFALALMLFASSAAAAQEADGDYEPPDWIKKPTGDEFNAVWPRGALQKGRGGRATLNCTITAQGLLEACSVRSEDPPGEGFGAAALLLAPSFVMKPAKRNGKPVQATAGIPVNFKAGSPISGVDLQSVPMISNPIWEKAPTFADMAAAWPKGAEVPFGHVSMRCRFAEAGELRRCEVLTESPKGRGFGKAAREAVAERFRLRVSPDVADRVEKAYVNLAVRFNNPNIDPDTPRTIVEPDWITRVNPEKVVSVYPEAAIKAGVKSGRGMTECVVGLDGKLTNCKPLAATPEGMGFSEAAVEVASVMVMNPWSDGGGPVDGVRIRLPVTFNLAPEVEPAAAKP